MDHGADQRLWAAVLAQAGGSSVSVRHVCAAIAALTGADGVAAALATSATLRETVYVEDDIAATLEELTVTLGEGPGVDAARTGEPVLVGDMAGPDAHARWPVFAPMAVAAGVYALFALPLRIGAIRLGVVTLYRRVAGSLPAATVSDALALTDAVCLLLVDQMGHADGWATDWRPRDGMRYPEVHQAAGMIIVQLGVTAEIAFARLRAHAFLHNRPLRDVAQDVVARRLRFEPDEGQDYADGR